MPTAPKSCDVTGGIPNHSLKAYGNFIYSDCTVAAYYHVEMFKNIARGSSFKKLLWRSGFHAPTNQDALSEYVEYLSERFHLNVTPQKSYGVAVDDFLDWQKTRGRVVEWAQLPPDANGRVSEAQLADALFTFRGVILAGNLTVNSYNNFPCPMWDVGADPKDTPSPTLAHAVALDRYSPEFDECVTWGERQRMTIGYRKTCFNGAFVFLLQSESSDADFADKLAKIKAMKAA